MFFVRVERRRLTYFVLHKILPMESGPRLSSLNLVWSLVSSNRNFSKKGSQYMTLSYATDIRPLFRQKDINAMRRWFDLSAYEDVRASGEVIYQRLSTKTMPCDGPWTDDNIAKFRQW